MYKYVDLFSGCGGLSLGIERSGGDLQLAVEKSDMAARTFHLNFLEKSADLASWTKYLAQPISEQSRSRLAVSPLRDVLDDAETMARLSEEGVDLVVGGPPCQGFSLAGRRNPDDVRNKLPWEFLEFVARTNPKMVVIENVVGMSHKFASDEESPFVQLQQALRETGEHYVVQGVAVNALHFGAPQNRPRLMIIGLRTDIAAEKNIASDGSIWSSTFADDQLAGPRPRLAPLPTVTRAESPTIADAIGDLQQVLPAPHTPRTKAFRAQVKSRTLWGLPKAAKQASIPNQTPRKHSESTKDRFRLYQWLRDNNFQPRLLSQLSSDVDGMRGATLEQISGGVFPAKSPDGVMIAETPEALLELMLALSTKKHTQKALAWDQPARTVVTLPDDYVHPSEPRIFTVREMARFQGFPDDFEFVGKETTGSLRRRFEVPQYSQVGNAVSPFLSLAVGKLVAETLGE